MTSVNVSQSISTTNKPLGSPSSVCSVAGVSGVAVEPSPVDRTKGFFPDESEPLLRCDSTSSKDSALSRNGSFITKDLASMRRPPTAGMLTVMWRDVQPSRWNGAPGHQVHLRYGHHHCHAGDLGRNVRTVTFSDPSTAPSPGRLSRGCSS
ncbi:uncharacterized protein AB9W97_003011 [Spinachia spinachia]